MSDKTTNNTFANHQKNDQELLQREISELHQKNNELEKKFALLTEVSQEGIIIIDDRLRIIFVNDELCSKTGYTSQELLGEDFRKLVAEDSIKEVMENYSKRTGGEAPPQRYVINAKCKDGTLINVGVSATTYKNSAGRTETFAHLLDITDKKETEDILKHRVEFEELIAAISTIFINFPGNRLDEMINYAIRKIAEFNKFDHGYIYMFSHQNVKMDKTHEWCRNSECDKSKINESVMAYTFPWIVEKLKRQENIHIQDLSELPKEAIDEIEFFNSRGVKSILIIPLVYNQTVTGFIGFESILKHVSLYTQDIRLMNLVAETIINAYKRKWSEQALKDNEERFRGIYEAGNIGIYRYSPNHTLELANPALIKMLGYDSFDELAIIDLRRDVFLNLKERNQFESLIRRTGSLDGYETQWRKADDSIVEMSESARIIKDEKGRITAYEGFVEDITAKKLAHQKLVEAKEAAEKSNKMKSDFLEQMSHEIRTPITGIINNTNMLKMMLDEHINEMMNSQFNNITDSGMRIIRTVDSIIDMSELQNNSYSPNPTEINVYEDVIDKHFSTYAKIAEQKNLSFVLDKPTTPVIINADAYSTNKIFEEVIDNAIKFTIDGEVEISYETEGDSFYITVKDSGIGISENYMPDIFKPFTQEEEGTNRTYEGNGLGLALAHEYCRINQFQIDIISQKQSGSTVKIRIT